MVKKLNVSIADHVMEQIDNQMVHYDYTNKSEFVEELIRHGLHHWKKNKLEGN